MHPESPTRTTYISVDDGLMLPKILLSDTDNRPVRLATRLNLGVWLAGGDVALALLETLLYCATKVRSSAWNTGARTSTMQQVLHRSLASLPISSGTGQLACPP